MENQPQNPEFRNSPENFHPCNIFEKLNKMETIDHDINSAFVHISQSLSKINLIFINLCLIQNNLLHFYNNKTFVMFTYWNSLDDTFGNRL